MTSQDDDSSAAKPPGDPAPVSGAAQGLRARAAQLWPFARTPRNQASQLALLRKSRLFDASWYLAQYPEVRQSGMDALQHYLLIGGFDGHKPNPYFDSKWYLETYPDVAASGVNPLLHFITEGAREKRVTGPLFDTRYYLERNPDVAASRFNPLTHYIRYGLKERRIAIPSLAQAAAPAVPAEALWRALKPRRDADARVDVIVPVYRGYEDTLACLYSVLAARVETPHELIVVEDASPDAALTARLRELAGLGLFNLLSNSENLGFVRSVNRGMARHADRDVVLLNSDTEVYDGWLDRLRSHAGGERVATVTPFSTNATICSYPATLRANPEKLELEYAALDRLAAEINSGEAVDVPTAVGFCMYVRRDCLAQIGDFDAETFGKGYGEENDFCRRAAERGWRNLLAADVFVRHTGSVSFADAAATAQAEAQRAILVKHPDYARLVRNYIRKDPAAPLRRRLDAARLRARTNGRAVLHITHNWGGGVDRHVRSLIAMFAAEGIGGYLMSAPSRGRPFVNIASADGMLLPNLQGLDLRRDLDGVAALLRIAGVDRIHVHSLAGWPTDAPRLIVDLAAKAGVPYDYTAHDYMPFCPRINLVDGRGNYCGEKGIMRCISCVAVNGSPFGRVNVVAWRTRFAALLATAEHIFAPSEDTRRRYAGYLGKRPVVLRSHPHLPVRGQALTRPWRKGETLRLLIVGAINDQKGARLLLAMADDALARNLPVEFRIVGFTSRDSAFASRANVVMTGRYEEADLPRLMAAQAAHVAFLPSLWPETHCYTLTATLEAGLPHAAFDIGAQAERLRAVAPETSLILDLGLAGKPAAVNDALLAWAGSAAGQPPDQPPAVAYTFQEYYGVSGSS